MKKQYLYSGFWAIIISLLIVSCAPIQNSNNTQKGVGAGAVVGGVVGAVLGNNLGSSSELGAVIGAAVGGTAGGLIGNKMDKQATEIENALPGAQVERVGEGIRVVLNENTVNFDFNSSDLTQTAMANLDKLIPALNTETQTDLQIQGYTDAKGSDAYNLKLSEKRAQSVYNYLVSHGIDGSRLSTVGYGEANPIADNETDEGRARNRRVEFIITANEDMQEAAKQEAGQ